MQVCLTPLARKKHRAAKAGVIRDITAFYDKSFPGKIEAPDVFWEFIDSNHILLSQQLQDAGENQSRINAACRRFVDLFRKSCVRARKLINEQTGNDDAAGRKGAGGRPEGQALEAPQRPEDYFIWKGSLG
jgi:hypothetical protein